MTTKSTPLTRRDFLAAATALTAAASLPRRADASPAEAATAASPYTLHFAQPAAKWPNALPVGNGRLGAMVFGNIAQERIQLNEESIWDGEPNRDRTNPRAAEAVPRIRELLFAGKIAEAEALATSDMLSVPRRMPCYQTLGDLHIDLSPMGLSDAAQVEDYRLQLDLDTAVVTTTYTYNGLHLRREVFSSAPDQVIAIRLSASTPGRLHLRLTLDRPGSFSVSRAATNRLQITGQALPVDDNPGLPDKEHQTGVRFLAQLLAIPNGGSILPASENPNTLEISGADTILLFIDCATSYRYPARAGKTSGVDADVLTGDPAAMRAAVDRNLTAAAARSWDELLARHTADHQRYFRRADFNLGPDPNASVPTDQRVEKIKQGGQDVHLIPIYFQFGRYMLISSSRPGTLAANLQGIWNESVNPPWGSKYTININTEMNYWFAEAANLADCQLPLFDLLHTTRKSGELSAREIYRAQGTVVHHNTDIWGDSGPIDGLGGGIWPMGANWLSLHLWKQYTFTEDRRFLAEHVYPALRERALFVLDYLVRDPRTGHLTTGPSCSPENAYLGPDGKKHNLCMGPTMDISIVRSLFARLLQVAALLPEDSIVRADSALLERARAAWSQLPPFQVAHDGRLQEWQQDYVDPEPGHRHISHLFGLFPEDQITPESTPELAQAARHTLDQRLAHGGGSTGWSRSWIINCMARLRDGEACYTNLLELFRQSTRVNLFDVCGLKENSPFQIDGNLGAPSGLIEMLLQSHGVTPLTPPPAGSPPVALDTAIPLRLLPALPKAWPNGSFRGLRARGRAELDLTWQSSKATRATLRCSARRSFELHAPAGQTITRILLNGKPQSRPSASGAPYRIDARPGDRFELEFA